MHTEVGPTAPRGEHEEGFVSMPTQVFISHISAERALARFLKIRVEKDFLGLVSVFVSSDQDSIEAGKSWLNALHRGLDNMGLQIVLCSPVSIGRPWVNFEAGAAWVKQIPIMPLCHSGLGLDKLPMPLSTFQGGIISEPDTFLRLYNRVAKLVPCVPPEVDMKALASEASNIKTDESYLLSATSVPQQYTLEQLCGYAEAGNKEAIQSIAITQSPESFSVLMQLAINHIDEGVKITAIRALSSFRTPGDITALCELLIQDRWQVAEACAKALGRFKMIQTIPYLIKASDQNVDWITTQASVTALGGFAPQQPEIVCPALIRALKLGSFAGRAASQSLQRYGSVALQFLLDGLQDDSSLEVADLFLKTIVLISDKRALSALETVRMRWREGASGTSSDAKLAYIDRSISQLRETPAG